MVQKSGFHQLRLAVYPVIYKALYIPGGAGFLPSTVWLRVYLLVNYNDDEPTGMCLKQGVVFDILPYKKSQKIEQKNSVFRVFSQLLRNAWFGPHTEAHKPRTNGYNFCILYYFV